MTYRSAEDALREKTTALETELRGLEEKRKSAASIDTEVGRVVEELRKSRTLLDRLEKKRALPMLDQVRVASPCNADWNAMVGDDRSRFCGKCEKNVYNLSAMTREDAELLMLEKDGRLCIRLFRRTDGTVITEDCPVGVRKKRLRLVGVLAIPRALVLHGGRRKSRRLRRRIRRRDARIAGRAAAESRHDGRVRDRRHAGARGFGRARPA